MNKNNSIITKINKGQRLTASKINQFAKGLNSLSRGYDNPNSTQRIFGEISRTVTVAEITPICSSDETIIMEPIEINQIDNITFKSSSGETITLKLFNPPVVED